MIRTWPRLAIAPVLLTLPAAAAITCDLNSPATDVPRLFPGATRFKTTYFSVTGPDLQKVLRRLGEPNRPLYEPLEVPYTIYEIFKGDARAGYIHGINQKGQFGVIQVFLALDLQGRVITFYIQKMTGPLAPKLRDPAFAGQFAALSLRDFRTFDPVLGKGTGRLAKIRNPVPGMDTDFFGVLRGLYKNLVLMDACFYSHAGDPA